MVKIKAYARPKNDAVFKVLVLTLSLICLAAIHRWCLLLMTLSSLEPPRQDNNPTKLRPDFWTSHWNKARQNALRQMEELTSLIAPQPSSATGQNLKSFELRSRKECLPGRDDSNGEINPTTHRQRECLRHVPKGIGDGKKESLGEPRPRIGIVGPPGHIFDMFALWLRDSIQPELTKTPMMSEESGMPSIPGAPGIPGMPVVNIIRSSRVPPYGYGKNHGWTKLIRFVDTSLLISVLDARSVSISDPNLSHDDPSTFSSAARQIVRWHCRLSHVSAHTAMLTVSLQDVLRDPVRVLTEVLAFVGRDDYNNNIASNETNGGNDEWEKYAKQRIDKIDDMFAIVKIADMAEKLSKTGIQLFSNPNNAKMIKHTQDALQDEMKLSKNMTSWPCPSFCTECGRSSMLATMAVYMVPDCRGNNPYVKCTVKRDLCETKYDPVCD